MDEITKKKISYKLRGRKKQARTKLLISRSMLGKPKTDQHKQAISAAMLEHWINKKDKIKKR
ncbi:hypothetical protein DW169_17590 [Bacteroides intestinalis]|uniref:hypothetical protein n=1 Tax=Bacteroides intestinalis TaxID=329854 RepID=UPI000E514019|nr:hypothetical protein [Bacteroides intestinalis]RHI29776.1 hypothetical protein DW169_17590 [Bacteroides intestinalis]